MNKHLNQRQVVRGRGKRKGGKKTQRPKVSMWRRQLYSCHSHVVCLCEPLSDSFEMHRKKNCKQTMSMSMWRWGDVEKWRCPRPAAKDWIIEEAMLNWRSKELSSCFCYCCCCCATVCSCPERLIQSDDVAKVLAWLKLKKLSPFHRCCISIRATDVSICEFMYIYCGSRSFCCDGCSKFWHSDLSHTHGEEEREGDSKLHMFYIYICFSLSVSVVILSLSRAANLVFPAGNCSFQSYKDKKPQKTKTRQSKKCEREGEIGRAPKNIINLGKKTTS